MRPGDCKNFDHCSAPICPLDPTWRRCRHLDGERVCHWLSEYSKEGGPARVLGAMPSDLSQLVANVHAEVLSGRGLLSKRLQRASETPSRIVASERLRARPIATQA